MFTKAVHSYGLSFGSNSNYLCRNRPIFSPTQLLVLNFLHQTYNFFNNSILLTHDHINRSGREDKTSICEDTRALEKVIGMDTFKWICGIFIYLMNIQSKWYILSLIYLTQFFFGLENVWEKFTQLG